MDQINFDYFLDGEKELIYCMLTSGYHWLRITSGHTPKEAAKRVHFTLDGYDYLYENTADKDETMSLFDGTIRKISWQEAMMAGEET